MYIMRTCISVLTAQGVIVPLTKRMV